MHNITNEKRELSGDFRPILSFLSNIGKTLAVRELYKIAVACTANRSILWQKIYIASY